jgi:hypothetical protein
MATIGQNPAQIFYHEIKRKTAQVKTKITMETTGQEMVYLGFSQ